MLMSLAAFLGFGLLRHAIQCAQDIVYNGTVQEKLEFVQRHIEEFDDSPGIAKLHMP